MVSRERLDVVVIGGGPAGQQAALQAAREEYRVLLIDRARTAGAHGLHRGAIPSKTLRETAVYLSGLRVRSEGAMGEPPRPGFEIERLMRRQTSVCRAHQDDLACALEAEGIRLCRGRARFVSPTEIEVTSPDGGLRRVEGGVIVMATGSRPRVPPHVPVDHQQVHDSDSILTLDRLPATLTVLGAGIVACEYASIFAALGVGVTLIDEGERPLAFLEPELTDLLVADLLDRGARFLARRKVRQVEGDGRSVTATLDDGEEVRSEKLLCAVGRVAEVGGLHLAAAGIDLTPRGNVAVDSHYRTSAPHIYAVGEVIGSPTLVASAMEQGRRAMRHALGLPLDDRSDATPLSVHTIPEIASVGLTEERARERHGGARVGRAHLHQLVRGRISGTRRGLLKLVAHPEDGRLLGAHVFGEGATELIHLAQMAIVWALPVEGFADNVFGFPTVAEAYGVAARDLARNRRKAAQQAA